MSKKTIMLVCSAGMSTSLLVSKMKKSAKEQGLDTDIFTVGVGEVDNTLSSKDVDVLMLGPQVRFMKDQFKKKLADKGIPVEVINMKDYGMVNGEKILQAAVELIK